MGRGGGCIPGKLSLRKKKKSSEESAPQGKDSDRIPEKSGGESPAIVPGEIASDNAAISTDLPASEPIPPKLKIFVVYYSTYGHVATLAKKIKEGVDSVEGVEGLLYQVPETLSEEVLSKMKAPSKDSSVPIISAEELTEADGIVFGFPTRYGSMAAQMKAFFDSTGTLWRGQLLAGKPAGFFVSTGTQGGGQETSAWTAITQLAHHGMLFVPIGYTFGAAMFKMDEIRGGSPYGAGTFAGDGSCTPGEIELALAEHQGKYTAGILRRIKSNET